MPANTLDTGKNRPLPTAGMPTRPPVVPGDGFGSGRRNPQTGQQYQLPSGEITLIRAISEGDSGQADIYLVENAKKKTFIFKKYKHGMRPKSDVLDRIRPLKHPHIIRLYDYGKHQDFFYELMEYAEGSRILSRGPIRDPEEFKKIIRQSVSAMHQFHQNGIVHRDIKPANLLLKNKKGTHVLLMDFGISSIVQEVNGRRETDFALSYDYAAPEILIRSGSEKDRIIIGPPVDYFSLGLTLISLWKGEDWCKGLNTLTITNQIGRGMVKPPKDMPGEIAHAIRGLLVLQDTHRWRYQEVQDWLKGKQVPVLRNPKVNDTSVQPFEFIRKDGKIYTADAPEDLADLILQFRHQGIKHLYRGHFYDWIKPQSLVLATELEDIVEGFPVDRQEQESGILSACYLFSSEKNFIDREGKKISLKSCTDIDQALDKIGNHLEDSNQAEAYLDSQTIRVFLLSQHQTAQALRIREEIQEPWQAGKISRKKAGNKLLLLLQKGDALRIEGQDYFSFSDLAAAPEKIKQRLVQELHTTDSKFLCWLEEMYLKSDSTDLSLCDIPELIDLISPMPWLKRYDRALFDRLNLKDPSGLTPLMTMARAGDAQACKGLLENGAEVDFKEAEGASAFTLAALYEQIEVMEVLAARGADINPTDGNGAPLIHRLTCNNCRKSLQFLLKKGILPDFRRKKDGWTPLMEAVSLDLKDSARILLAGGARPNKADHNNQTPLDRAVIDGNIDMVRLLLENKACPNRRSDFMPLHRAVKNKRTDIARLLLEKGADPNRKTSKKQTPLLFAVYDNNPDPDMVELLLKKGARAYVTDGHPENKPVSPFCYAAQYHGLPILSLFLKYKARPSRAAATDRNKQGPLFYAIKGAQLDNIERLCQDRRRLLVKDKNGRTALEAARRWSSSAAVSTLKPYIRPSRRRRTSGGSLRSVFQAVVRLLIRIPAAFLILYTHLWAESRDYFLSPNFLSQRGWVQDLLIPAGAGIAVVWYLAFLPLGDRERGRKHPFRTTLIAVAWGLLVQFAPGFLSGVTFPEVLPGAIANGLQSINPFVSLHLWATLHLSSLEALAGYLWRFEFLRAAPGNYGILLVTAAALLILLILSRLTIRRK